MAASFFHLVLSCLLDLHIFCKYFHKIQKPFSRSSNVQVFVSRDKYIHTQLSGNAICIWLVRKHVSEVRFNACVFGIPNRLIRICIDDVRGPAFVQPL